MGFNRVFYGFLMFSKGFPMVFQGFSMGFLWFFQTIFGKDYPS